MPLDSGAVVAIDDDVPANNATTLADEDGVRGRLATRGHRRRCGDGGVTRRRQHATLVNSARTRPVTIKLERVALSGDTGADSKGLQVTWSCVDATHVNGVATDANRVVFTLVESPAGTFTFTLMDQVDHLPPGRGGTMRR